MGAELRMPPGFRFHPTDEELVMHYLVKRCASQHIDVPIIAEIDLYKYNPWELPDLALYGEKEWYFFSHRDRKYPNGSRPNRGAGSGYWKATGADKPIGQPKAVGIKKALVFYAGKAPKGDKTNWIMHEYRMADVDRCARNHKNNLRLDEWVLCRIYNKKGTIEKKKSTTKLSTIQEEDGKKEEQDVFNSDVMYFDTSDSIPKLHNDSSSSEFTNEVQSQRKLNIHKDGLYFPFNYMDGAAIAPPMGGGGGTMGDVGLFMNDEFVGCNYQMQDMFMGMLPY